MCEPKVPAPRKSKAGRKRELKDAKNYCVALGSNHRRMIRRLKTERDLSSESATIRKMIEIAAGED